MQMVLITSGLLVTYGNAIFAAVRDLTAQEILLVIQKVDVLIGALPPVGTSMAAMMAVSHATYLVAKAADTPSPKPVQHYPRGLSGIVRRSARPDNSRSNRFRKPASA
ncbi:hypothetical protein BRDID11002_26290 [Bradyrhizobium diazoefficiens]